MKSSGPLMSKLRTRWGKSSSFVPDLPCRFFELRFPLSSQPQQACRRSNHFPSLASLSFSRRPFLPDQQRTLACHVASICCTLPLHLSMSTQNELLLASNVWRRISLEILPLGQAASFRHAVAFRCALLLGVESVGAPDAVGLRGRSRRVLVRVDRAKRAVVHTSGFFVGPVRSSRALFCYGGRKGRRGATGCSSRGIGWPPLLCSESWVGGGTMRRALVLTRTFPALLCSKRAFEMTVDDACISSILLFGPPILYAKGISSFRSAVRRSSNSQFSCRSLILSMQVQSLSPEGTYLPYRTRCCDRCRVCTPT